MLSGSLVNLPCSFHPFSPSESTTPMPCRLWDLPIHDHASVIDGHCTLPNAKLWEPAVLQNFKLSMNLSKNVQNRFTTSCYARAHSLHAKSLRSIDPFHEAFLWTHPILPHICTSNIFQLHPFKGLTPNILCSRAHPPSYPTRNHPDAFCCVFLAMWQVGCYKSWPNCLACQEFGKWCWMSLKLTML